MGLFDLWRGRPAPAGRIEPVIAHVPVVPAVKAMAGDAMVFSGLDDPRLLEFIRTGGGVATAAGLSVTPEQAMRNTAVLRSVLLISGSIGMLPLHLQRRDKKTKAEDHPLFRVLHRRPNAWMTAFEFRQLMQRWALVDGDALARKVTVAGRVTALLPLHRSRWTVDQTSAGSLEYRVSRKDNSPVVLRQEDVFHVRGPLSDDGITGLSLVRQAAEAIALAIQTERASARLFEKGMIVGQVLKHKGKLSQEAYDRLKASMEEREGAANAHKTLLLEEDMDIASGASSGRDAQALEQRALQIEEIGRAFGVPRPLLGVDDTSWGSGVDVLGQMFVQYGLNPWFEAWQQAIERDLLSEKEADLYQAKFNPGALLRGSMQAQAEFFAKALGSGGHAPWMMQSEVRDALDLVELDPSQLPAAPGQSSVGGRNVAS